MRKLRLEFEFHRFRQSERICYFQLKLWRLSSKLRPMKQRQVLKGFRRRTLQQEYCLLRPMRRGSLRLNKKFRFDLHLCCSSSRYSSCCCPKRSMCLKWFASIEFLNFDNCLRCLLNRNRSAKYFQLEHQR